jgi:hypothetical protein
MGTILVSLDFVDVDDVVGVELAFVIEMFLGELALIEVVEESIVGHEVGGIEGAADALLVVLAHDYCEIISGSGHWMDYRWWMIFDE